MPSSCGSWVEDDDADDADDVDGEDEEDVDVVVVPPSKIVVVVFRLTVNGYRSRQRSVGSDWNRSKFARDSLYLKISDIAPISLRQNETYDSPFISKNET